MNRQQIYLALYKGRRDGSGWRVWCARATDWLTRKLTRGQYRNTLRHRSIPATPLPSAIKACAAK